MTTGAWPDGGGPDQVPGALDGIGSQIEAATGLLGARIGSDRCPSVLLASRAPKFIYVLMRAAIGDGRWGISCCRCYDALAVLVVPYRRGPASLLGRTRRLVMSAPATLSA